MNKINIRQLKNFIFDLQVYLHLSIIHNIKIQTFLPLKVQFESRLLYKNIVQFSKLNMRNIWPHHISHLYSIWYYFQDLELWESVYQCDFDVSCTYLHSYVFHLRYVNMFVRKTYKLTYFFMYESVCMNVFISLCMRLCILISKTTNFTLICSWLSNVLIVLCFVIRSINCCVH